LLELRGAGIARTDEHALQGVVEPRQRLVCIALVGTAHPDGGDLHEVERLERPLVDLARPRFRALPSAITDLALPRAGDLDPERPIAAERAVQLGGLCLREATEVDLDARQHPGAAVDV